MSYATQDGDKFYWINPPDAREGDECNTDNSKWWRCDHTDFEIKTDYPNHKRRRLIAPGEGWRICGLDELKPMCFWPDGWQITFDGINWSTARNMVIGQQNIKEFLENCHMTGYNILAIRQRIPVEAGKDDEWPRYWLRPDDHVVKVHIGRKGHAESELWNGFQWVLHGCCWTDNYFKEKGYKRLTPAEAQARMEGKPAQVVGEELAKYLDEVQVLGQDKYLLQEQLLAASEVIEKCEKELLKFAPQSPMCFCDHCEALAAIKEWKKQ